MKAVRKLFLKLLIFALPFLVYGGVIVLVDPYNMFSRTGPVSEEIKLETSFKLNYALWKLLEYKADPAPAVIFGDSRAMGLDPAELTERTGVRFANLAYGGGSLREAIDSFWIAAGETQLTQVYFGVNLDLYNAANDKNRVSEVRAIMGNRLLYFCNLNVLKSGWVIGKSLVTGREARVGKPPMDRDKFWTHQLDVTTRVFYASYRYPDQYHGELVEIADYCAAHGIQMSFIIFPGHADLQAQVARYGLESQYETFKTDLRSIARTYDFEFLNEMTTNRDCFDDPYHLKRAYHSLVPDGIWGDDTRYVRIGQVAGHGAANTIQDTGAIQ